MPRNNAAPASSTTRSGVEKDVGLARFMSGVFAYVASGLALTAGIAWWANGVPEIQHALTQSWFKWLLFFGLIGISWILSSAIGAMSVGTAVALFYAISAAFGILTSTLPNYYPWIELLRIFMMTTAGFLGLCVYGLVTKRDLGPLGAFCTIGLFGLLVGLLFNLVIGSPAFSLSLAVVGLLIFAGLTASDIQMLRKIYNDADSKATLAKKSILGALNLYLDFINLFLRLLQIFGRRK